MLIQKLILKMNRREGEAYWQTCVHVVGVASFSKTRPCDISSPL